MARKDVIRGFQKIEKQYFSMLKNVEEYDKALKDKFISQEQFEQAQMILKDLKQNYDRWSYIMFLLNQPSKDSKKPGYEKQNSKLVSHFNKTKSTLEDVLDEGEDCMKNFKEYIKTLGE